MEAEDVVRALEAVAKGLEATRKSQDALRHEVSRLVEAFTKLEARAPVSPPEGSDTLTAAKAELVDQLGSGLLDALGLRGKRKRGG